MPKKKADLLQKYDLWKTHPKETLELEEIDEVEDTTMVANDEEGNLTLLSKEDTVI